MDIFNEIQTRLIRDEKLPLAYAAVMAAQALNDFQPELQQAVRQWAEGKSVAQAALGDHTVEKIQREIGGSEFQALCLLSMSARHPGCFDEAVLFLPQDSVNLYEDDLNVPDQQDEETEPLDEAYVLKDMDDDDE